jgi:hypothetical protein
MDIYEVQLILKNNFGEFVGKKAYISQEQYNNHEREPTNVGRYIFHTIWGKC